MNVEFVRFKATDNVELQGWLSKQPGETAVLHIHGMGGNGYENYFLDNIRSMYERLGISFFSIDSRGRGIVSDFRQGDSWKHAGSCFEIFEESIYDIEGSIDYLKSRGITKFILQGHSLGGSKIVNYLVKNQPQDIDKVILLAPTDMVSWANADPDHQKNLDKAKQLLSEGQGEKLVGAQCWPLDKTPLSAQSYLSKSGISAPVDIYGIREDGKAPIGMITQPMLIPYGTEDIGITHPFSNMDVFKLKLDKVKHPNTQLAIIPGSGHSFRGFEGILTDMIGKFVTAR